MSLKVSGLGSRVIDCFIGKVGCRIGVCVVIAYRLFNRMLGFSKWKVDISFFWVVYWDGFGLKFWCIG